MVYLLKESFPPSRLCGSSSARRLAAVLAAMVLVATAPAYGEFNLAAAPNWARTLLLGGWLVLAYLMWMALTPCREALWAITCVLALAGAAGVLVLAVVLFTPQDRPLPLGMTAARGWAAAWCAVVAALASIGTLLVGRLAAAMQKSG